MHKFILVDIAAPVHVGSRQVRVNVCVRSCSCILTLPERFPSRMFTRETLERQQIVIYAIALLVAAVAGLALRASRGLHVFIEPAIGMMRHRLGTLVFDVAAWMPVTMMALTLLVVVALQIGTVAAHAALLARAVPVYVAFLVLAPIVGSLSARLFRLDVEAGRSVAFSAAIRNSLVVLPLGLALPDPAGALVAAVIVTQTYADPR